MWKADRTVTALLVLLMLVGAGLLVANFAAGSPAAEDRQTVEQQVMYEASWRPIAQHTSVLEWRGVVCVLWRSGGGRPVMDCVVAP